MARLTKRTPIPKWLAAIIILICAASALFLGFVAYSIYDCATTECESSPDENGKPQAIRNAISYAKEQCRKSYDTEDCSTLLGKEGSWLCGFRGPCGWYVDIYSPESSDFIYKGNVLMEKNLAQSYQAEQFLEQDSVNTREVANVMWKMCNAYEPTKKVGCGDDDGDLVLGIYWDQNTGIGKAGFGEAHESFTSGSYDFNVVLNRQGEIKRAYIDYYGDENRSFWFKDDTTIDFEYIK